MTDTNSPRNPGQRAADDYVRSVDKLEQQADDYLRPFRKLQKQADDYRRSLSELETKLRDHLLRYSVRTGDFTLKSGRKSNWFIDAKQSACRPDGITLIADLALERLAEWRDAELDRRIDAIGGLTMGADPLSFGVAALAAQRDFPMRSFSVRKQAKDHGVEGLVAGSLQAGDHVVVTEDVATRGQSAMAAVDAVRAFGATPVLVLSIVDRGGTCGAIAAKAGLDYLPLLTAPQLGFTYEP